MDGSALSSDADAVSQAAAAAVAAAAQALLAEQQPSSYEDAPGPPVPLPSGWVRKASQSQPECFYYYHYESGLSTWERPLSREEEEQQQMQAMDHSQEDRTATVTPTEPWADPSRSSEDAGESSSKRAAPSVLEPAASSDAAAPPPTKRSRSTPKQVRVLHILKKHKDSRKPSSWRAPKITQSLEDARAEVQELLHVLLEVKDHAEELRATFEELARTESDCSSAKRGGDLGYFGPKKMQPAFEKASFALEVGELSGLVETSSGVHVILRIG